MILKIYSILDSVVGAYLQPFYTRSEAEAVRMVRLAVKDPASNFNKNSADYALAYHGEYDDATGDFSTHSPQRLLLLSSLVEAPKPHISEADLKHFLPADPETRN